MPTTLIQQNPSFTKEVKDGHTLSISEMFCDTLQGEGVTAGVISTFLRLQGCTLECKWCDTLEVWKNGNKYNFDEIFKLWDDVGLPLRLQRGQHLIITGGSPLKQQEELVHFITAIYGRYGFKPYIEVENETVLMPSAELIFLVDQWNNSPKLGNSGMKARARYKPDVIRATSKLNNSWFKFVISSHIDWDEISNAFLPFINLSQIILMPEGQTQDELNKSRELTADLAIKHGVRFSDRMHVTIWNKKTGV